MSAANSSENEIGRIDHTRVCDVDIIRKQQRRSIEIHVKSFGTSQASKKEFLMGANDRPKNLLLHNGSIGPDCF
jgi:hypothetical protein